MGCRAPKDFPLYFISEHLKPSSPRGETPKEEGRIEKIHGKKCAVYRDEKGKETILNPVCPHMGCIVRWNGVEKTWDCPCHGSRFQATGEVMAGPAESPLADKDELV